MDNRNRKKAESLRQRRADGYVVLEKNDGGDYWGLYRRFLRGEVTAKTFRAAAKARDVHLLDDGGKKYILKIDRSGWGFGGESGLERFFWKMVRGPFYSRLMRRLARARADGCDRCQEMFMAAEKRTLHYCHEAVVLFEYLEGDTLEKLPDLAPLLPGIRDCLDTLHRHDLALCDINPRNFVLTPDGVKAIDLVCRGNARIDRVKDTIRAKKVFGIDLPLRGGLDRLCHRVLETFQKLRTRYVEWKLTRRTLHREKHFRK